MTLVHAGWREHCEVVFVDDALKLEGSRTELITIESTAWAHEYRKEVDLSNNTRPWIGRVPSGLSPSLSQVDYYVYRRRANSSA